MTPDASVVQADMPVEQLSQLPLETGHHGVPMVDPGGGLVGIATLTDLQRATDSGDPDQVVGDIATSSPITCFPDQTVRQALEQLGGREVGPLPVVDRLDPTRVLGMLRRGNIIAAYPRLLHEHSHVRQESERLRLSVPGLATIEMQIPQGAGVVGHTLQSIGMPPSSLLVAIRRNGRVIIPHGDTMLLPGDVVTALVDPAQARTLEEQFTAPAAGFRGKQ